MKASQNFYSPVYPINNDRSLIDWCKLFLGILGEKSSKKTLSCHKFLQQDTHVPAILGKKRKKDKKVRKNSSSDEDDEPVIKKRGNKAVSDNPQETASADLWVQAGMISYYCNQLTCVDKEKEVKETGYFGNENDS